MNFSISEGGLLIKMVESLLLMWAGADEKKHQSLSKTDRLRNSGGGEILKFYSQLHIMR